MPPGFPAAPDHPGSAIPSFPAESLRKLAVNGVAVTPYGKYAYLLGCQDKKISSISLVSGLRFSIPS